MQTRGLLVVVTGAASAPGRDNNYCPDGGRSHSADGAAESGL